jgi:hypothetical protein
MFAKDEVVGADHVCVVVRIVLLGMRFASGEFLADCDELVPAGRVRTLVEDVARLVGPLA